MEYGESIEDCSRREVLEETGMKLDGVKFLTITNDVFHDAQKHFITIFMLGVVADDSFEPKVCLIFMGRVYSLMF